MSCSRDPLGRPWELLSQQSFSQEVALDLSVFFSNENINTIPACFESSFESRGTVTTPGRFLSSAVN